MAAERTGTSTARTSAAGRCTTWSGSPSDPMRLYASQSTGWFGQIIQRSDDGGQSWQPVGNGFGYDGDARHPPVVRRDAAPVGVRARLAPRTLADRSRHGVCRRRGRGAVQVDRRRDDLGRALRAAYTHHRRRPGSPVRGGCASIRSWSTRPTPNASMWPSPQPGCSAATTGGDLAADQPRPALGGQSPTLRPRSATASTGSRGTRRAQMCCSCRSTGT